MSGVDLDDAVAVEAADPAGMLRTVATSAAQVRHAVTATAESDFSAVLGEGRPRAVVCVGMGGSGIAGDLFAAMAGMTCPVPVAVHKGYGLPGWVGVADLVLAVSCSGGTAETLSAADEAIRRGSQLVAVGAADSPLAARAAQAHAPFVPVPAGRPPRASMWALTMPGLLLAERLGLLPEPLAAEQCALRLEQIAASCHPARESFINPGKDLALSLHGRLVQVWGSTPLAGVAAYRFACQLNENAKVPAAYGVLPEAWHNQVMSYDGPFAAGEADVFADPDVDGAPGRTLVQVVLRDEADERREVTAHLPSASDIAAARGVPVLPVPAEGGGRLERLAALVGLVDYASVYLALLGGLDPTPVGAIAALKAARP